MNLPKFLGTALITGVTGLTALVVENNADNPASTRQPSVLTQDQIQYARPLSFFANDYPTINHPQLKKADSEESKTQTVPPAPEIPPAPEVRLPDPSELFRNERLKENEVSPAPAPEPKPNLGYIKPEPQQTKPVYDFPAPAPQPETVKKFNEINLYESNQIHRFVSKLSLPQFPLTTACVEKNKKHVSSLTLLMNLQSLFPFLPKNKDGIIAEAQYTEFQPELGMNLIDTRTELESLATGIARRYQPANLDSKAFEKLAEYAGLDSKFVERLEGTRDATIYDVLSQFSAQYADSLRSNRNHQFPGLVVYQTLEGHLHVTGNAQEVKQIKQKIK